MSNFTNISNTSLFECDDSGDGKFIAFYKKEGTVDLNQPVPAETIWTDCVGYYLFLHQRPGNLEQFASDVDGHIGTFEQGAGRGGFLWLDYSDGLEEVGHILTEKETNGQGNEDDEVTAITDVTIEFANYRLPIKTGMVVEYDDTWLDGICFTILYPPDPEPSCPDTAVAPGADPDYALYLWLTGVKFGCFEGIGIINDYFSTDATTSWDIVIRYAVKIEDDTVHQLYPIFDVSSGKRPLYTMCWDPLDHLNPDRTYLKFKGTSVLFEKDGPGECDYKLGVPDDPEIIPTYFRTVTGETMAFIAVTGGDHPAKLVFEVFQEEGENTDLRYYLVPCGEFETVVISSSGSMIDSGSGETEFPGKFLCGLSGIESVGFHPKTSTGSGDKIRFYPKHPAYAPLFPIIPIDAEAPAGDPMPTTPILTDTFRTAWAGFTPGTASGLTRNLYFAQPEDAPLYIDRVPPWIWDARAFLTLLEPKAEEIPSTTQAINQDVGEHCFPLAPATKAVPATAVAGDARKTFLIDV